MLVMAMAGHRAAVQSQLPTVSPASMVLLESSDNYTLVPSVMSAQLGLTGVTHTEACLAIRGLEHPQPKVHCCLLEKRTRDIACFLLNILKG